MFMGKNFGPKNGPLREEKFHFMRRGWPLREEKFHFNCRN